MDFFFLMRVGLTKITDLWFRLAFILYWSHLEKVVLMLDSLFTGFTEIEVLTFATYISDTHNGLNAAAVALKLWCSLLNCTTRFLLNDLSKDVVYLALDFFADQILYCLHRYFSIFLLFVYLWLFRFSRLLGFNLSFGEFN